MPSFPINPVLEHAVRTDGDDDLPRLAYADWLDENGDADRAEFIRAQCRLAELSPAEPDWVELTERQDELAARLRGRLAGLSPVPLDGFSFVPRFLDESEPPFRRGFPYFINASWETGTSTPPEVARLVGNLPRLVETTTVRGLHLGAISAEGLASILAAPAFSHFTGLAISPQTTADEEAGPGWGPVYQALADHPAVRQVRQFGLYGRLRGQAVRALAGANGLGAVRRLAIQDIAARPPTLTRLLEAPWFGQLRHLSIRLDDLPVASVVAVALGRLPELHTLALPDFAAGAVPQLAAGRFLSLGRLVLGCPLHWMMAGALATARFPRLAVLAAARCHMNNDAFTALLEASWFAQLRVLDLTGNSIGDMGVAALAASPAARSLHVLRLGDNNFGKTGLSRLARASAFGQLCVLDLGSFLQRKVQEADLAAFLSALALPRLRHLDLSGWPIGDTGARALAASPALAGLTRLGLARCGIGDAGARALITSPHLQKLLRLRLDDNAIRTGADDLADPAVMPHLGECGLNGNNVPKAAIEKIRAADRHVSC